MVDEEGIAENMAKGRGITSKEKKPFTIVGADASDRNHPLVTGEGERGRGRPPRPESPFTPVGPTAEEEEAASQKAADEKT
jgi:hypothetical protein